MIARLKLMDRKKLVRYSIIGTVAFATVLYFMFQIFAAFNPSTDIKDTPYYEPDGRAPITQSRIIEVFQIEAANPKATYYQLDDRKFRADFMNKSVDIPWQEIDGIDYPQQNELNDIILDMAPYRPATMTSRFPLEIGYSEPKTEFSVSEVSNDRIVEAQYTPSLGVYEGVNTQPVLTENEEYLQVSVRTMGSITSSFYEMTDEKAVTDSGKRKRVAEYDLDMNVSWRGELITTKTINASTQKTTLKVGETSTSTVTVTTTGFQASAGPVDVNNNSAATTWTSSDESVATVGAYNGTITAVSPGTTTITVTWKKEDAENDFEIYREIQITVIADDETPPPDGGGGTDPLPEPELPMEYELDIDPDDRRIQIGDTKDFEARFREREIGTETWSSWSKLSDSEVTWIATIDSGGNVNGLIDGDTRVTVQWNGLTDRGDVTVYAPNPVPVIEGPTEVKENRPLPMPFSSARSYSPISGRTIDHTRDAWTNKQDKYTVPGEVEVELHVYDNTGMKSLRPDRHTLTILPDEPPVAKGEIVPLGLRNRTYTFYNKSYSPDGDIIISSEYKVRYDSNNNGFNDDAWQPLAGDTAKATFTPTKVGKYQFYVKVTEDYGKTDDTITGPQDLLTLDVQNQAPAVSFQIEGSNPQPDLNPPTVFTPQAIYDNWTLYRTDSTQSITARKGMHWTVRDTLAGGLGRLPEQIRFNGQFDNRGFGNNNLSPYRAIETPDSRYRYPLLVPDSSAPKGWGGVFNNSSFQLLGTTRTHFYFQYQNKLFAYNKSKMSRFTFNDEVNGVDTDVRGYDLIDGSPYDLILSSSNIPTYYIYRDYINQERAGTLPAETLSTSSKPGYTIAGASVKTFTVSENTIYASGTFTCSCSYDEEDGWRNISIRALFTFDLKTGELVSASLPNGKGYYQAAGNSEQVTMRGEHLIVRYRSGLIGEPIRNHPQVSVVVLDRNLQEVWHGPIPYYPTGTFDGNTAYFHVPVTHWFQGPDGEYYYYEVGEFTKNNGSNNFAAVTFLTRLNPNFTIAWRTRLAGHRPTSAELSGADIPRVFINPIRYEISVATWNRAWFNDDDGFAQTQRIDMNSGAIISSATGNAPFPLFMDWNGNYRSDPNIVNDDGPNTRQPFNATTDGRITSGNTVWTSSGTKYNWGSSTIHLNDSSNGSSNIVHFINHGMYLGDGLLLAEQGGYLTLYYGTPTSDPLVARGFSLGQFLSAFDAGNLEINFTMSLDDADGDSDFAGFAFRSVNSVNKYAVETNGSMLYLTKYINGARTVLQQINYPFHLYGSCVRFECESPGRRCAVFRCDGYTVHNG